MFIIHNLTWCHCPMSSSGVTITIMPPWQPGRHLTSSALFCQHTLWGLVRFNKCCKRVTTWFITRCVLLSCPLHFPDNWLLESLKSSTERLWGCSQLSQADNEENDTSVTSGQWPGSQKWTVANLRRDFYHEIMNDTVFIISCSSYFYCSRKRIVIDGLLRLERILNIFLNPRPLDRSVGLTS